MENWEQELRRIQKEGRDYHDAKLQERMRKGSAADRGVASAVWLAWKDAEDCKLIPGVDENGETVATPSQAYVAACYARQDVAAVFHMQEQALRIAHRLEKYAFFLCVVLVYIAIKVT